ASRVPHGGATARSARIGRIRRRLSDGGIVRRAATRGAGPRADQCPLAAAGRRAHIRSRRSDRARDHGVAQDTQPKRPDDAGHGDAQSASDCRGRSHVAHRERQPRIMSVAEHPLQIGGPATAGLLRSGVVATALMAGTTVFAMDQAIGWYQTNRLEQKRLADLELQHAAFAGLNVDLLKVAYEPDRKSYRLTMAMTNLDPHSIY